MTNAEKFKEVFGFDVAMCASDPCDIIDQMVCIENHCQTCPVYDFWNKEYKDARD